MSAIQKELDSLFQSLEKLGWKKKYEHYINGTYIFHFMNENKEILRVHYNTFPDEEEIEALENGYQ